MIEKLKAVQLDIENIILNNSEETEKFRLTYLSRKGLLNELFEEFKTIPNDQKKEVGKIMNQVKQLAQEKFDQAQQQFENSGSETELNIDLTLPAEPIKLGSRHPLVLIEKKIVSIFNKLGISL